MIELSFSAADTGGADRGPRGTMDFASTDLYDLTCEAFWGPYTFRVEGADFSGTGPVLDLALGLFTAAGELAGAGRARYSAAGGAGEYRFERRGGKETVRIHRERDGKGSAEYAEFESATRAFLGEVVRGLCDRFPDLRRNPEIRRLREAAAGG
ncbi:hypothetical protein OG618_35365 [Kitasatospora sp. NBC_01246]|uniref:hypothetical protein n=1 Tax=Kitasatospora sp. NBC_01246 TaxID=2903570 RepID=UPI002E38026F|nr:hypothetical protein [Kitasatospora sp. NBC_01246]